MAFGPACLVGKACRDRLLVARLFRDRRVSRDWSAQENEQAFPKLRSLGLPDRICQRAFSMASTNVSRSDCGYEEAFGAGVVVYVRETRKPSAQLTKGPSRTYAFPAS